MSKLIAKAIMDDHLETPELTEEEWDLIERHHDEQILFRKKHKNQSTFSDKLLDIAPTAHMDIIIDHEDYDGENLIGMKIKGSFYPVTSKEFVFNLTFNIDEAEAMANYLQFLCKKYKNK